MSDTQQVTLHNVLEDEHPDITTYLDVDQDGILLNDLNDRVTYRVVVENIEGKLMVHVWATEASIGNDPTHSIEIERRRNGKLTLVECPECERDLGLDATSCPTCSGGK